MQHFGERLRILREEKGLGKRALARLAGISASAIVKFENYGNAPRYATLEALAAALGVAPADLLSSDHRPAPVVAEREQQAQDLARRIVMLKPKQRQAVFAVVDSFFRPPMKPEGVYRYAG